MEILFGFPLMSIIASVLMSLIWSRFTVKKVAQRDDEIMRLKAEITVLTRLIEEVSGNKPRRLKHVMQYLSWKK